MINIEKKDVPIELAKLVKQTKNYRHKDVIEKIKEDFNNKCYICELKESTSINIEHFIPHRGDDKLKYEWSNLYFACSHCNGIKGDKYDIILDPLKDDVESAIWCKMDTIPMAKVEVKALKNDVKTKNTVNMLEQVFNTDKSSAPIRVAECQNLKKKLLDELRDFTASLYNYYYEDCFEEDKQAEKKKIIRHLHKNSAFTAFKRCIVIDNKRIYEEFKEYIK